MKNLILFSLFLAFIGCSQQRKFTYIGYSGPMPSIQAFEIDPHYGDIHPSARIDIDTFFVTQNQPCILAWLDTLPEHRGYPTNLHYLSISMDTATKSCEFNGEKYSLLYFFSRFVSWTPLTSNGEPHHDGHVMVFRVTGNDTIQVGDMLKATYTVGGCCDSPESHVIKALEQAPADPQAFEWDPQKRIGYVDSTMGLGFWDSAGYGGGVYDTVDTGSGGESQTGTIVSKESDFSRFITDSAGLVVSGTLNIYSIDTASWQTAGDRFEEEVLDTIPVLLLVGDTARYVRSYFSNSGLWMKPDTTYYSNHEVGWWKGYNVRQKFCCINGNTGMTLVYQPIPYYEHRYYLDEKKKRLSPNIVVFQAQ